MTRKTSQLCAVTVGIDTYILPMADGLRLVEIMGRAMAAERNYRLSGRKYTLCTGSHRDVTELELVRPDDIDDEDTIVTPARRAKVLALPSK
jgi:hypothetical protein